MDEGREAESETPSASKASSLTGAVAPAPEAPSTDDTLELSATATLDTSLPASAATPSNTFKFDSVKANAMIAKGDWIGLNDYICQSVSAIINKDPEDVGSIHPGLVFIPRVKIIAQMLSSNKFEEAQAFFITAVKPLKDCKSNFKPLNMDQSIDDMEELVNSGSAFSSGEMEAVKTEILDYIKLYLSDMVPWHNVGHDLGQFVERVQVTEVLNGNSVQKNRFRCLACQWLSPSSKSIGSIRLHLTHDPHSKCCTKVTQEILDRLTALDGSKRVPSISELAQQSSKHLKREHLKRKAPPTSSSSGHPMAISSPSEKASGSNPTAILSPSEKSLAISSQSEKVQFATESTRAKVVKVDPVFEKADRLHSISSAISTCVKSFASAEGREQCTELLQEHEKVLTELKSLYLCGFLQQNTTTEASPEEDH